MKLLTWPSSSFGFFGGVSVTKGEPGLLHVGSCPLSWDPGLPWEQQWGICYTQVHDLEVVISGLVIIQSYWSLYLYLLNLALTISVKIIDDIVRFCLSGFVH